MESKPLTHEDLEIDTLSNLIDTYNNNCEKGNVSFSKKLSNNLFEKNDIYLTIYNRHLETKEKVKKFEKKIEICNLLNVYEGEADLITPHHNKTNEKELNKLEINLSIKQRNLNAEQTAMLALIKASENRINKYTQKYEKEIEKYNRKNNLKIAN